VFTRTKIQSEISERKLFRCNFAKVDLYRVNKRNIKVRHPEKNID
jgi:hypothetical protein